MHITHVFFIGPDFSLWERCAQLLLGSPLLELIWALHTAPVREVVTHQGRFKVDVTVRFHTSVILRRQPDHTMKTSPTSRIRTRKLI